MPTKPKNEWIHDESKILDEDNFSSADRELFNQFVKGTHADDSITVSSMVPGQILKGKIVLVTKDFVIVDVGLKSEGLIPIGEFEDPNEIIIGGEVEVLLD